MKIKKCCESCVGKRTNCWIYNSNVTNCQWDKNENFCNKYLKDASLIRKKRNIQSERLISQLLDEAYCVTNDGKVRYDDLKKLCVKVLDDIVK